jgi:hypothetical protein
MTLTVRTFKQDGRDYRASVLPNQGTDLDFPADRYPVVLFIRDLANPLASGWKYAESQEQAEQWLDLQNY